MNGSDSNNNTLNITSGLAGIRKGMKTARLASVVASSLLVLSLSGCAKKTTEDHLSAAAEFAKDGDNNAAVVELKNAIQLSPKMANARLELGKVYLNLSQYEPAEKELNKALELGASEVDVIPFLARAYQGIGATSALEVIDHDLAGLTTVQKAEVGYFKAQSLIQLQKIDEARVLIEQLVVLDTNSAYKGLSSVLKMVLDGENENALELAIQLQAQAPLNKDVLNITARLYFLNQQPEKAADVYASYVKAAPKDIETKFRLAAMLVEQGRSKEAEPYVDELMELNDQNPLLNQLKGIIKATYEDYPAAQRFSETAINNGSNDPIVRMVAGYSAFKQGDFESASGHFETIASVLPDNHPALRMLAASQLQIGKTTEATDVLARLDELTPEDASLFSKAGYELLRSGNVTQAKGLVDKATGISDSSDDLLRLGVLKLELNNIEGVLDLENAVAKSPESVTARSTLATAYLASNKLDEASKLATTWKAENGDQPGGFLLAGQIALRQDDLQLARNEFMTAAVVAPDNNMVRMSLIGLDILEKKNDEALKQVESLLKDSPDFVPAINAYFSLMTEKDKAEAGMQPALSSLKNNPDNSLLRTTIARMYLSQSKEAEAMDMLNAVPADASAPQQYWLAKGLLHLKNKENAAAREHYETWLEVSPNNPDAVLGNLLILDSQNQYPEALALIERVSLVRESMQLDILRSYFLVMSRKVEEANSLVQSFPANVQAAPFVQGVKARISLMQGKPEEAIGNAKASYEANPNTKNMMILNDAFMGSGQGSESTALLQAHYDNNKQDLTALMLLAEKSIEGDLTTAIEQYETALTMNENNFIALNNLAYLLTEKGDLAKAEPLAKRAFDLKPNNPPTVDTYAQILAKQGKLDEAISTYNRVMNDDIEDEVIILNYIEVLLMNKNERIAKRRIEETVLENPDSVTRLQELTKQYNL